ncbi:MAG: hypothetical protein ACT4NU_03350, partial [Chromatiales bacterium]
AAQGCAAIFEGGKPLKMKQSKNHAFCFACSEKSRMGLFRASLAIQFARKLHFHSVRQKGAYAATVIPYRECTESSAREGDGTHPCGWIPANPWPE